MADKARALKVADRVKELAASVVERRIKDPRLGFVTITDCRVTPDLEHAKLYYTVLGDADAQASSAAALKSASGMVRSEVGKQLGIRLTPTLEFVPDAVPETAAVIDDALKRAKQRDEELHAQAATSSYAGDADPYKKPADEDDE